MDWPQLLQNVLLTLGGSAVLVAALAYLAKSLLTLWLDKDLEKHKQRLQHESELALEHLRADLRHKALEHEVTYRRNDEKIADVLSHVYIKLWKFYRCAESYVKWLEHSSEPSKAEKNKAAVEALDDFWAYLDDHRLYIPPALYNTPEAFALQLKTITNRFTFDHVKDQQGGDVDMHYWSNAFDAVTKDSRPALDALVEEFQRRLGIHDLLPAPTDLVAGPKGIKEAAQRSATVKPP